MITIDHDLAQRPNRLRRCAAAFGVQRFDRFVHASIIDRPTFEAVQAKLAETAGARRIRVESSPAILMGRTFDDRGNRMTPSHSNKDGVRYRYYVCHTLLQGRKKDAVGPPSARSDKPSFRSTKPCKSSPPNQSSGSEPNTAESS
jgi:hypothetical protein